MRNCILIAVGYAVLFPPVVLSQEDGKGEARVIIEKAIAASGGKDNLAKLKAGVTKIKGTIQQAGNPIALTAEISLQGATKERAVYRFGVCGEKITLINVLNGDKGWNKVGEDTLEEMDEKELKEAKQQAYANWLTTLLPLLEKEITLSPLGEKTVDGRPAVGVKASQKGRRDVSLFFDKENSLLVLVETRVLDLEKDEEVTETNYYRDYQEMEGIKQATKFVIKRDGKPYFDGRVTELKLVDKFEESVFAKP